MELKISDIFQIDSSLDKLIDLKIDYPINLSFALYKKSKELKEIATYVYAKIKTVINEEHISKNELTAEENIIYTSIMDNPIEIEPINYELSSLLLDENIKLSVQDIDNLSKILSTPKKKSK